jgi:hypothetical protein
VRRSRVAAVDWSSASSIQSRRSRSASSHWRCHGSSSRAVTPTWRSNLMAPSWRSTVSTVSSSVRTWQTSREGQVFSPTLRRMTRAAGRRAIERVTRGKHLPVVHYRLVLCLVMLICIWGRVVGVLVLLPPSF